MISQKYKENMAACDSLIRQGVSKNELKRIANESGFWDIPQIETRVERAFHKITKRLSTYDLARYISSLLPESEATKRIDFHYQFRKQHPDDYERGRSCVFFEALKKNFPEELEGFGQERRQVLYIRGQSLDTLLALQQKDDVEISARTTS